MCQTANQPQLPDWMTRLILDHQVGLYALCYQRVGNPHDAEDLASETITLVLMKWATYDRERPFWPWLERIAVNRLWSQLRRKTVKWQPLVEEADSMTDELPVDHGVQELDRIINHEDRTRLQAAVGALPEMYREVVQLRYFDYLDYKEIAEALGLPDGTVGRRLNEAKKLLAKALEDVSR
jgi:RNA polymerase sigma-70 factor (ECF subfamily)